MPTRGGCLSDEHIKAIILAWIDLTIASITSIKEVQGNWQPLDLSTDLEKLSTLRDWFEDQSLNEISSEQWEMLRTGLLATQKRLFELERLIMEHF